MIKGQKCIVKPEGVPAKLFKFKYTHIISMKLFIKLIKECNLNIDIHYSDYIGHLLNKIFWRRQLFSSLKFSYEDFVFGYKTDIPQPLNGLEHDLSGKLSNFIFTI